MTTQGWRHLLLAAFFAAGTAAAAGPADTILVNGKVVTVDDLFRVAEAVEV